MVSGFQAGYADYQGDREPRLQPPAEVPDSMAHIWREAYRSGWMELAAEDVPHC
ncbi:hypothetical protein N825_00900 [Skermanella stibiiresistens SB22]|uniref:Ribosome modulation factor n=1 Tax=Skermanella stibiiresistens SB22 TaxID=1385369 RepID=W9HDN8_9PROT|nr:hypothetical protein N825_00900 [Skermanella stibiiresistens SB22]